MSTAFFATGKPVAPRYKGLRPVGSCDSRATGLWHYCGQALDRINSGLRIKGYSAPGETTCGDHCPGCGEKVLVRDVDPHKPSFKCPECNGEIETLAEERAVATNGGCARCLGWAADRAREEQERRASLTPEDLLAGWAMRDGTHYRLFREPADTARPISDALASVTDKLNALQQVGQELERDDPDAAWALLAPWVKRCSPDVDLTALAEEFGDLAAVFGCRTLAKAVWVVAEGYARAEREAAVRERQGGPVGTCARCNRPFTGEAAASIASRLGCCNRCRGNAFGPWNNRARSAA